MEAATAPPSLFARARAERFERECERLRPIGVSYLLGRFGDSMNRADAEDAVAEVLLRFHRMSAAGTPPQNLRATFFTSVRNQAIDQLRAQAVRPTVGLEAAGETPAGEPAPSEWAESREEAARLQEALGRMRGNYREAIMLRYGLGLSVPEIAEHFAISLPAAKKLVLRATAQARKRMQAVEGCDFCPDMRELARRAVIEKELAGVGEERELALLRTHISHCGSCKSFLATLHGHLHDLGGAALFGLFGADRLGPHLQLIEGLGRWGAAALESAGAAGARVRHLAYKASGAFSGSDNAPAGALLSTGQKIAAVCTAGAATTATCLLAGAVGPPNGAPAASPAEPERPAAQVREQRLPEMGAVPEPTPSVAEPQPEPAAAPEPQQPRTPAPAQVVQEPEPVGAAPAQSSEPQSPLTSVEGTSTPTPAPSAVAPSAARSAPSGEAEVNSPPAHGSGSGGSGVGFQG